MFEIRELLLPAVILPTRTILVAVKLRSKTLDSALNENDLFSDRRCKQYIEALLMWLECWYYAAARDILASFHL